MDAFTDSFPTAQPVDGAAMTTSVPGARIKGTPLTLTLSIICHMPGDVGSGTQSTRMPHQILRIAVSTCISLIRLVATVFLLTP